MQTRVTHFLRRVIPTLLLLASYSTFSQTVSDEYLIAQEQLLHLTDSGQYEEAIEFTRSTPASDDHMRSLFTMVRNWCYVKQRLIQPQVESECKIAHRFLRNKNDSVSTYLNGRILEVLGHYYYQRSDSNNGLAYLDSSAVLYTNARVNDRAIHNLKTIGNIHYRRGNRPMAARYYLQALSIFSSEKVDSSYYFELMLELGNIHLDLEQYDKAEAYYNSIVTNIQSSENPSLVADATLNLGNLYQQKGLIELAKGYYANALDSYTELCDSAQSAKVLHNLGSLVLEIQPEESLMYYRQSLAIKEKLGDSLAIANTLYNIALLKFRDGDYNVAYQIATRSLRLSRQGDLNKVHSDILILLSKVQAKRGRYKEAYDYQSRYVTLCDSMAKINEYAAVDRIKEISEIEQQQALIANYVDDTALNAERLKKSKVVNYALAGASILLIIILVLLMTNFQQIQRTKNSLFRKNLEVTAAEALIKGQEEERQRLAHQLHDKVGNHITVLKNHIVASGSSDDHLMQIVKDMSTEVRNISQDLMPPVLERFGLADALEELCARYRDQMEATIDLNIDQSRMTLLNNDDQINIYRLVQEIIQISLFQYQANYLLIEMRWDDKGVWVSIEDNGTRRPRIMDDDLVLQPWKGIENRVQFLKGELRRGNHNQGNEYQVFIPKPQS